MTIHAKIATLDQMARYPGDEDKVEKFILLDVIQLHLIEESIAKNEQETAKIQVQRARANEKFQKALQDNKDYSKDQEDMDRADFLLQNL